MEKLVNGRTDKTFGCDDCRYLTGKRCKLWQVKVEDAHNQHCESGKPAIKDFAILAEHLGRM
jgi:hypothetical protein